MTDLVSYQTHLLLSILHIEKLLYNNAKTEDRRKIASSGRRREMTSSKCPAGSASKIGEGERDLDSTEIALAGGMLNGSSGSSTRFKSLRKGWREHLRDQRFA